MTKPVSQIKRTHKTCRRCQARKPVGEFAPDTTTAHRSRDARCIECRAAITTRPAQTQNAWLPEDGIIDEIAIDIAATGARRVSLTLIEARAAAAKARRWGIGDEVIAERVGITSACLRIWDYEGRLDAAAALADAA